MVMSYEEAVAAVTAPGQMFSVVETEVLGRPTKVYENIFPTRARASLVLTKGDSHRIEQVALRKL